MRVTRARRQMTGFDKLAEMIDGRTAEVGVVGLGYVGLPLVDALLSAGFTVRGVDVDSSKVDAIRQHAPYIDHFSGSLWMNLFDGKFEASTQMSSLAHCDVVLIAVPTPLDQHRNPDMSYVEKAVHEVGLFISKSCLVVLESTTYPGTTRDIVQPLLERASGMKVGEELFVGYSPEREDPGSEYTTSSIPKLVSGLTGECLWLTHTLYKSFVDALHPCRTCEIAEAAKIHENVFRAVNIALANEMKVVLDAMDIDVWEVIDAASTKPFGFMRFTPGPGLGGHCIPIDPFYLSWKAREAGVQANFIEMAGVVNSSMPSRVVEKTARALSDAGKSVLGSHVLIVGVAYKPNVDDDRESPAFDIMEQLVDRGAVVQYHDPHIPTLRRGRKNKCKGQSVVLNDYIVNGVDAIVIVTDHDVIDWEAIEQAGCVKVDTRNRLTGEGVVRA